MLNNSQTNDAMSLLVVTEPNPPTEWPRIENAPCGRMSGSSPSGNASGCLMPMTGYSRGLWASMFCTTGRRGPPRAEPQVRSGLSPQLTLEGAMLRQGAFPNVPAGGSISTYTYVALRGGDPA